MHFRLSHPTSDDKHHYNQSVQFVAAMVEDKTLISKLIKELDLIFPLSHAFGHVKRVKKSEHSIDILLWPLDQDADFDRGCLEKYYIAQQNLFTAMVPKFPPRTKEHWLEINPLWPVTLHVIIPKFPSWDTFDVEYKAFVTQQSTKSISVLFSPSSLAIIASAEKKNCQGPNPLLHPTMLILNQLALRISKAKRSKSFNREFLPLDAYFATGLDLILREEPCVMLVLS